MYFYSQVNYFLFTDGLIKVTLKLIWILGFWIEMLSRLILICICLGVTFKSNLTLENSSMKFTCLFCNIVKIYLAVLSTQLKFTSCLLWWRHVGRTVLRYCCESGWGLKDRGIEKCVSISVAPAYLQKKIHGLPKDWKRSAGRAPGADLSITSAPFPIGVESWTWRGWNITFRSRDTSPPPGRAVAPPEDARALPGFHFPGIGKTSREQWKKNRRRKTEKRRRRTRGYLVHCGLTAAKDSFVPRKRVVILVLSDRYCDYPRGTRFPETEGSFLSLPLPAPSAHAVIVFGPPPRQRDAYFTTSKTVWHNGHRRSMGVSYDPIYRRVVPAISVSVLSVPNFARVSSFRKSNAIVSLNFFRDRPSPLVVLFARTFPATFQKFLISNTAIHNEYLF